MIGFTRLEWYRKTSETAAKDGAATSGVLSAKNTNSGTKRWLQPNTV